MSNEILQDTNGKPSSKRIAGFICLFAGIGLLLVVGITSIFRVIADPTTSIAAGSTLVITGASLLGVSVIEKLGTVGN